MNFHYVWKEKSEDPWDQTHTNSQTPEYPVWCGKKNYCNEYHQANTKTRNETEEEITQFIVFTESKSKTSTQKDRANKNNPA